MSNCCKTRSEAPFPDDEDEKSPSPSVSTGSITKPRKRRYWLDPVETKHGDLLLFACCFVQGLLDASAFINWNTFVGMQTGNTIFLALSTASLPRGQPWAYALTLISIASFIVGCFVATRVAMALGPKRRIVFAGQFFTQCLLLVLAAGLASGGIIYTDKEEDPSVLLRDIRILNGIAPLSFQSGMTIATSRLIGLGEELPVVVYTATYAGLAGDMDLFKGRPLSANIGRNRRLTAVFSVFAGAVVSTWIEVRSIGFVATLWMAVAIKVALTVVVVTLFPRDDAWRRKNAVSKEGDVA